MKTKKQFIKQLLSIVLCLALVLTYVPLTAFATAEKEPGVKIMRTANTLYYDANGGEGGPSSNYTGGTGITVQTSKPTREGYVFNGWNTKADGTGESYDGGATYTFTEDNGNGGCKVTLYAQWVEAYGVYVGGVQVIETNKDDVFGDGKVSYDAETTTLTLNGVEILNGHEYKEDCVAGIYAEGDLNIELIGTENIVTAPDSKEISYGIRIKGDLNLSGDGTLTANGGKVTAQDTDADSVGIFTDGLLYISQATVNANGESAVVNGKGIGYSNGVYSEGGLDVDFEGCLFAKSAKAQGNEAYSHGIEVYGDKDNYINVSVYSGYLIAEGGEAVGTDYAGSAGICIIRGGLYLYEAKADAEFFAGKAEVTSEDEDNAYAYSNGIYIFAGDVGISDGKLEVTSGSYDGVNGDAYAVYLWKEELKDDDGNPYFVGGNFTVECDEVKPGLYTPNLVGTTVTINAPNGNAIHADGGIDISDKLIISLPENGKVSGIGGSTDPDNWKEPSYWTILDSEGAKAQNVIIKPLAYKVYMKGLSYDMEVMVPVGESVNKTYCELFEVDDFSESLNTEKEGYTFGGWYTDEACTEGNKFDFNDPVNSDITIFAKWVLVAIDDIEDDGNKPSDDTLSDITSPATGDNGSLWLWFAVLVVSVTGIFGIIVNNRRRRNANENK